MKNKNSSPFRTGLSKPGPPYYRTQVIYRTEYSSYKESKLLKSGDIEKQPGPKTYKKTHKTNLMNIMILFITFIIILNKITERKEVQPTSSYQTTKSLVIKSIANFLILNRNKLTSKKLITKSTSSLICIMLIIAGDIHPNPGPSPTKACLMCGLQDRDLIILTCETCKNYCHLQCSKDGRDGQSQNTEKSFEWICPNQYCKPNHHLGVADLTTRVSNQYSILGSLTTINKLKKSKNPKCSKTVRNKNTPTRQKEEYPLLKYLTKITSTEYIGKEICRKCHVCIGKVQKAISCDDCKRWTHLNCSDMTLKQYNVNTNKSFLWICNSCRTSDTHTFEKINLKTLTVEELPIDENELKQNPGDFLLLHYNCRSIINKFEEIHNTCKNLQPDVVCLTETWLDSSSGKTAYIPEGYNVIREDRKDDFKQKYGKNNGGGIAVLYKEELRIRKLNIKNNTEETMWIEVKSNPNFIIGIIYRADYTDLLKEGENGTELETQLTEASMKNKRLIVIGDFNCDTASETPDKATEVLTDIFYNQSMKQLIEKPTRIDKKKNKATTIDHIWTEPELKLIKKSGTVVGVSDHTGLYAILSTKKEKTEPTKTRFRSYKNYVPEKFNQELQLALEDNELKHLIDTKQVNESTELFISIFKETAANHAPIREVIKSKSRKFIPWFTQELETLIRDKTKRLKLYWLDGYLSDNRIVKLLTNKITHLKRKLRKDYYSEKLQQYDGDPRKMWRVLKEVTQTEQKHANIEPEFMDQITANEFNNYFANVGSTIQKRLNVDEAELNETTIGTFQFKKITKETVLKLIDRIKIDVAVGIDEIPARLLKDSKYTIAETLMKLVNISFNKCIFPNCMKSANIKPIHKKEDPEEPSNYRPLSILPIVSKIFERAATDQIVTYLEQNNLLNETQHAYQKCHSTQTCLSEILNYIYRERDKGNLVGIASLDLSKAFDSICHTHLIQKLQKLGLGKLSLDWCKSYLQGRTQRTKFKNYTSTVEEVTSGVPQGSILGPIFFICFINDMPQDFKNCKLVSYADDTQILVSAKNSQQIKSMLEYLIHEAQKWYKRNSLLNNASKTEVMLIGRRKNKEQFEINVTEEGIHKKIKLKKAVKVLGVYLDEELNWNRQVNEVNKKAKYSVRNLHRVNQLLPHKSKILLYNSLVASHFNYADTVWGGLNAKNKNKLQRTQNAAVKSILGMHKKDSSVQALKAVKLLPLEQKRKVHEAVYIYKGISGELPTSIAREYQQHTSLKNNRSAKRSILTIPKHKTEQYKNSPLYRTIKVWNSIPAEFKEKEMTTNTFKKKYQAHLQAAFVK